MAKSTPEVRLVNGHPITSTRNIAKAFGKNHRDVTRIIPRLDCSDQFLTANFCAVKYIHRGNEYTEYLVTKDGFTFLAMGFTGKKAAEFKEKYIAEFNRMEAQLKKQQDAFSRLPMLSDQDRSKLKNAANSFIDLFGGIKTRKEASMLVAYIARSVDEYSEQEGREALLGFRLKEVIGFNFNPDTAVCQRDYECFLKQVAPDDMAWLKTKLSWIN